MLVQGLIILELHNSRQNLQDTEKKYVATKS